MKKEGTEAVEESSMVGFQGQLLSEEGAEDDDVYTWMKKGSNKLRVCNNSAKREKIHWHYHFAD